MSDRDDLHPKDDDRPVALRRVDFDAHSDRDLPAPIRRPVVVVLGMHRSGTSLLSNALHVLGVDMADTTDRVNEKNAGGYWERPDMFRLQDEVLAALGRPIGSPSHVLPFPAGWWRRKEVQAIKPKLIAYLKDQLGRSSSPWGFKDPRTCRLLPLWWEVFREVNVEPIYVHAIRSPAEAAVSMSQQSPARKLSVANSELMWLSYNYDIARYVTVKAPVLTVHYDEWFDDANAVAQRLCDHLGIGEDLSSEEISECMETIVRRDLRHHAEGGEGVVAGTPLATMLYKAMRARDASGEPDLHALRGQLRLVDLFFKSLGPVAWELDEAAAATAELKAQLDEAAAETADLKAQLDGALEREAEAQARDEQAQAQAGTSADSLTEKDAKLAELADQRATLEARLGEAQREIETLIAQLAGTGDEQATIQMRLAEAEVELVEARQEFERRLKEAEARADQAMAAKAQVESELAEAQSAERTAREQLAARTAERDAAVSDAKDVERAAQEALAAKQAEFEVELGQARSAQQAAREALEAQLAEFDGKLAEVRSAEQAARQELAARTGELEVEAAHARAEAEVAQAELAQIIARTEEPLRRARRRSRALLRKAREWRDAYVAEHGEDAARLQGVDQAKQFQDSLAVAQDRLRVAEERVRRLLEELDLRDRALAAVTRRDSVSTRASVAEGIFQWPRQEGDESAADGEIERVDEEGIAGRITVGGSSLVPIVEVRAGTSLLLAQTCSPQPGGTDGAWQFHIGWDRIGLEHAGRELSLRIAGVDREIGRAAVPVDLVRHHQPPAARAVDLFGGTMAEAAEYQRWIRAHESAEEAATARQYRADQMNAWPPITVIVHGEDEARFEATCQSLRSQTYVDWEAICIGGPDELADSDARIQVTAPSDVDWAVPADALLSFVEAGDVLAPTALLHLAMAAQAEPGFALLYSDEDTIDPPSGLRGAPLFKGAWSPDLALARDYVSRLALVRRPSLSEVPIDAAGVAQALLNVAFNGEGPVIHLPFVLYHRSTVNAAKPLDWAQITRTVVESTPALSGVDVQSRPGKRVKIAWPLPNPPPRVSLIVPTRDRVDLLRVCVDGFLHETKYANLEILIADNESEEAETRAYLAKVGTHPRVRVIPCPGPFNYSKINNTAAEKASGEIIGLMNNDLKVLDPDWLREMVSHAVRPDVGIVGAKLLYGDGTIQHAGVTLGIGLASHLYKAAAGSAEGRQGRLVLPQDLSAVTAACLVMRREVWTEVGGLDEEFPVAYNDIDLCLKVRAAGYRVLWTPDALVYHLESQSRGKDVSPDKRERLESDKKRLMERWGAVLSADPFHSPNLSVAHVDARLAFPPRATAEWQRMAAAQ